MNVYKPIQITVMNNAEIGGAPMAHSTERNPWKTCKPSGVKKARKSEDRKEAEKSNRLSRQNTQFLSTPNNYAFGTHELKGDEGVHLNRPIGAYRMQSPSFTLRTKYEGKSVVMQNQANKANMDLMQQRVPILQGLVQHQSQMSQSSDESSEHDGKTLKLRTVNVFEERKGNFSHHRHNPNSNNSKGLLPEYFNNRMIKNHVRMMNGR